jgi:hypothetical protein
MGTQTRKFWLTELLGFITVGQDMYCSRGDDTPLFSVWRSLSDELVWMGHVPGGL